MDTHDTHILATPRDLIRWAVSRFNEAGLYFGHGTDNALDEAAYLVLHTLHLPLDLPASYLEAALTASERAAVLAVLQRRVEERVPAAYLTGEAWFAGLPFFVTPDVLVPRSPIAELIEHHFEPWVDPHRVERILDLCTGSGCIGIAAASYFPDAMVDISDISTPALAVARGNVARHHLEGQVRVVESDLFEGLRGEHYDVIVSNPPYVDARDMRDLPEEFHREPRLGLAGGEDGLDLVARILAEAENHLTPDGILVVEVGNSAEALVQRYPTLPFTWFEFERGGDGVLLLSAEQLGEHRSELAMGPE